MLSTLIIWTSTFDFEHAARLKIGRLSRGAFADHNVILIDEGRGDVLATSELKRYPRWSEPVAGLVARALHSCIAPGTPGHLIAVHPIRTLQVKIALVPGGVGKPRALTCFSADLREVQARVMWTDETAAGASQIRDVPFGTHDPLSLTLQLFSQWLWHAPMPRVDPEPLDVPVYRSADIRYVRLRDIPEPARRAFSRRLDGATVPAIPGEDDIAYAGDWIEFVGG